MGKKSRAKAARRENIKDTRQAPSAGASSAAPGRSSPPGQPLHRPAARGPAVRSRSSPLAGRVLELLSEGQPEAALSLLQQTPPARGQESGHRNLVAICLTALHRYEQAYPLLTAAEAEGGITPDMQLALAETEANLGLTAHFEKRVRRLSQAYPDLPAVGSAREYARTLHAERQARASELGVDVTSLEEAAFLRESSQMPLNEGDFATAIRLCRQAVERCPADDVSHSALAIALAASGEEGGARDALEWLSDHAAALTPSSAAGAARLYVTLGLPDRARKVAAPLLAEPIDANNRPWKSEVLAFLGDHQALRELLRGARDLTPRERFALGVASANLGDLPAARRELRAAAAAGLNDPVIQRCIEWADEGRTDLPYAGALELAQPALAHLFRLVLRNNDPVDIEKLKALAVPGTHAIELVDRLMMESPPIGARLLSAIGTPEALDRLQQFASAETSPIPDRILALSYLRDAGAIAEDEPVDLTYEGETVSVVLGRHRIIPERPITVPDEHAAQLFDAAVRLLGADPEGAYSRFLELDEYFPGSAEVKVRLGQLSQNQGRLEESRSWLNQALEINPQSVEARIGMGAQCLSEGDLRGAIEHSRAVDEAEAITVNELMYYQNIRQSLNSLLESPLADALMAQAEMAPDDESAEANRELAGMLGAMQKSLALTQYLRQRPVSNLHEDLTLAEVMSEIDDAVIYNAAWLFGLIPQLEALSDADSDGDIAGTAESGMDDEELSEPEEHYPDAAREMLARELLDADRLAQGLPGMTDRDLDAAEWLLARGGVSSLDEYLAAFPVDETAPSDMLLEYGIVADGRLAGKLTRMVPVDLKSPLAEALSHRSEW